MPQNYWDLMTQFSSYIFLALSVSFGVLCLIVWGEIKKGKQRKRAEEEKRLKELTGGDGTSIEELEKRYGKKG